MCEPEEERFAPARFINEHELTVFSCVPSVAASMDRLGLLTEGRFPTLRWVTFCGEALPMRLAQKMQEAAPNATIENMYGPTECTVGVTSYIWDPETSPDECRRNIVPIGTPFPGHRARIMDGELCISGPQVFDGYWRDEEATRQAFYGPWYRTGDIVERDESGLLHYVGREDQQVQVRGHRVELAEVEGALRDVLGNPEVACVPWPVEDGRVEGIVACVAPDCRYMGMEAEIADRLADYKRPTDWLWMDELPKNANGKIDRRALKALLRENREAA